MGKDTVMQDDQQSTEELQTAPEDMSEEEIGAWLEEGGEEDESAEEGPETKESETPAGC